MKYILRLLLVAVLCPLFSKAQSNFKPGYVVALNGDTIKGAIDYKEWNKTPKEIKFKADNSNAVTSYNPVSVLAFGVTNYAYYRSFLVPISKSQEELSSLSNGIDTTTVTENVFLNIITQGKNVTLYAYNDIKLILFTATGNDNPEPLIRYVYSDARGNEANVDVYKEQLQKLRVKFQPGNTHLKYEITGLFYFLNDVKKIIISINGGTEDQNGVKPINTAGHRFFVGGGVNVSAIDYTFGVIIYPPQVFKANSSSIFPQISLGYDYILNKDVGKWLIRAELGLTGSKVNMAIDRRSTDDFIKSLKYDQYLLSFSPQVIFNAYNAKKLKVYLSGGPTVNFSQMSNKHYYYIAYNNYNKAEVFNGELVFPETESLFFSFIGKVGVVVSNRVEIYAGAAPNILLTKNSSDLKVTTYKAGINFLFGKK